MGNHKFVVGLAGSMSSADREAVARKILAIPSTYKGPRVPNIDSMMPQDATTDEAGLVAGGLLTRGLVSLIPGGTSKDFDAIAQQIAQGEPVYVADIDDHSIQLTGSDDLVPVYHALTGETGSDDDMTLLTGDPIKDAKIKHKLIEKRKLRIQNILHRKGARQNIPLAECFTGDTELPNGAAGTKGLYSAVGRDVAAQAAATAASSTTPSEALAMAAHDLTSQIESFKAELAESAASMRSRTAKLEADQITLMRLELALDIMNAPADLIQYLKAGGVSFGSVSAFQDSLAPLVASIASSGLSSIWKRTSAHVRSVLGNGDVNLDEFVSDAEAEALLASYNAKSTPAAPLGEIPEDDMPFGDVPSFITPASFSSISAEVGSGDSEDKTLLTKLAEGVGHTAGQMFDGVRNTWQEMDPKAKLGLAALGGAGAMYLIPKGMAGLQQLLLMRALTNRVDGPGREEFIAASTADAQQNALKSQSGLLRNGTLYVSTEDGDPIPSAAIAVPADSGYRLLQLGKALNSRLEHNNWLTVKPTAMGEISDPQSAWTGKVTPMAPPLYITNDGEIIQSSLPYLPMMGGFKDKLKKFAAKAAGAIKSVASSGLGKLALSGLSSIIPGGAMATGLLGKLTSKASGLPKLPLGRESAASVAPAPPASAPIVASVPPTSPGSTAAASASLATALTEAESRKSAANEKSRALAGIYEPGELDLYLSGASATASPAVSGEPVTTGFIPLLISAVTIGAELIPWIAKAWKGRAAAKAAKALVASGNLAANKTVVTKGLDLFKAAAKASASFIKGALKNNPKLWKFGALGILGVMAYTSGAKFRLRREIEDILGGKTHADRLVMLLKKCDNDPNSSELSEEERAELVFLMTRVSELGSESLKKEIYADVSASDMAAASSRVAANAAKRARPSYPDSNYSPWAFPGQSGDTTVVPLKPGETPPPLGGTNDGLPHSKDGDIAESPNSPSAVAALLGLDDVDWKKWGPVIAGVAGLGLGGALVAAIKAKKKREGQNYVIPVSFGEPMPVWDQSGVRVIIDDAFQA